MNSESIIRPIPLIFNFNQAQPNSSCFENGLGVKQEEYSTNSSRCTSNESSEHMSGLKIRRGRPQQEIEDGQDAQSQKKRHRRMYARQYRAQMRQKVDNVKSLKSEKDQLENQVKFLQSQLLALQNQIQQRDTYIQILHFTTQLANKPKVL